MHITMLTSFMHSYTCAHTIQTIHLKRHSLPLMNMHSRTRTHVLIVHTTYTNIHVLNYPNTIMFRSYFQYLLTDAYLHIYSVTYTHALMHTHTYNSNNQYKKHMLNQDAISALKRKDIINILFTYSCKHRC